MNKFVDDEKMTEIFKKLISCLTLRNSNASESVAEPSSDIIIRQQQSIDMNIQLNP